MGWIKDIKARRLENKAKEFKYMADHYNSYSSHDHFSFYKTQDQQVTTTKIIYSRPNPIDYTDKLVANEALLRGFYHNTYPGLKLAGVFAKKPIDTPIGLMGIPIPKVEGNVKLQREIDFWVSNNTSIFENIHREAHLIGTCWVWPKYSQKLNKILIEFIPDSSVLPPIKDLDTGEIIQIITDEIIEVIYNEDQITYCRRKRIFTQDVIQVIWIDKGSLSSVLRDEKYRNPTGILPINFTNRAGINEVRGHSDYESVIPDLKNYHDNDLAWSRGLVKFSPKQVHTLAPGATPENWESNNAVHIENVDIYERDFYMNVAEEKDEFIFPNGAFDAYAKKAEVIYWKIVQGTDIPELFWGLNASGNHATELNSNGQIINYTKAKQNQHTQNYNKFFNAIASLQSIITMNSKQSKISTEWNKLDSLDEQTQADILTKFTASVSSIITNASGTLEQVYKLWVEMYPEFTEDSYDNWLVKISQTSKHKAFTAADYEMIADMSGDDTDRAIIDENKPAPKIVPGKAIDENAGEENIQDEDVE